MGLAQPPRLHVEEGAGHDPHHMIQETVRFHPETEQVPFPVNLRQADRSHMVLHPASGSAESRKIMGADKEGGGTVHLLLIQTGRTMQGVPGIKGIPGRSVPNLVPIPFPRRHIARMEVRCHLPAASHGYI